MVEAIATTAFAPLLATLPAGEGGLIVTERSGLGIATVMARAGRQDALVEQARTLYGIVPADGPRRVAAGDIAFVGTGPGAWLMLADGVGPDWAAEAASAFAGVASLFDQSSGYAMLRLSGADAARVLQAGLFLDLHPRAFPPGAAAVSVIAHVGVILWRLDQDDGFEIAVFRSFASSFWHWLTTAAAAMGIVLHRPA